MEIERKWKLSPKQAVEFINDSWPEKCFEIFQGYFYCDDPNKEFRVRLILNGDEPNESKAYLTIKDKTYKKERKELEISIEKETTFLLFKECEYFCKKKRFICKNGLELNMYKQEKKDFSQLDPLVIIEKEFDSLEESEQYVPEFQFEEEVTENPEYFNFNLCKKFNETLENIFLKSYMEMLAKINK